MTNQQKSEIEWEKEFKKIIIPVGQFLATNDYFDYVKRMKDFIRQTLAQSRQQFVEEILGEFPDEVLADDEAVCTTCSDYEVPCCGGCPPCECHKLGTEEWKKWQERKRIHFRGKKYGKIEMIEKVKQIIQANLTKE